MHSTVTESGPVVHSTVTDGLHPGPTTTKQALGGVTESKEIGNDKITLPFFGPVGPGPTTSGQLEQNQGTGSESAVALPITQPTDRSQTLSTAGAESTSQIIVGGQTYTANPSSRFIIGSQTLQPGGPAITHDGHTISLGSPTSNIVVDSSTDVSSVLLTKTTLLLNAAPVLTLGDQTLVPGGPAITFSGTRISLAPSASDIIIGSSTEALGSIILGGIGPSRTATSTGVGSTNATATDAEVFTGGARLAKTISSWGTAAFLVVIGLVVG